MKAGRPRSLIPNPRFYRETIITMMRYGGSIDNIAKDLGMPEDFLVNYIKEEGLDKLLSRRSWTWKTKSPRKRYSIRGLKRKD